MIYIASAFFGKACWNLKASFAKSPYKLGRATYLQYIWFSHTWLTVHGSYIHGSQFMVHVSWFTYTWIMVHGSWFTHTQFMVHGSHIHGSWFMVHYINSYIYSCYLKSRKQIVKIDNTYNPYATYKDCTSQSCILFNICIKEQQGVNCASKSR